MPKIPRFRQPTQVRRVDQSAQFAPNLGQRAQAEALQTVGSGLQRLGQGIDQFNNRKDKVKDNLLQQTSVNAARRSVQDAFDFSFTSPDAKADGSNSIDIYEKSIQEDRKEFLSSLGPDDRAKADVVWEQELLRKRQEIQTKSRQKFLDFTQKQSEEIRRGKSNDVFLNPGNFVAARGELNEHYDTLREQMGLNEGQVEKLKKQSDRELGLQVVNGFSEKGKFAEAKNILNTEEFTEIFNAEEKQKLRRVIENNRLRAIDRDLKNQALQRRQDEEEQKEKQREIFANFLARAKSAVDVGEKEQLEKDLVLQQGSDQITKSQASLVRSIMDRDLKINDDITSFQFAERIFSGENVDSLTREISDAVDDGQMKGSTARTLLNRIETRRRRGESPESKRRLSLGKRRLDAVFGSKSFLDSLGGRGKAKAIRKNDAMIKMFDLMAKDPSLDPVRAANIVIDQFGEKLSTVSFAPGIDPGEQISLSGIQRAASRLKAQQKNGSISDKQYKKAAKVLMERYRILKSEEEIKEDLKREKELKGRPSGQ